MFGRKGQSAMEYLMTYGWAILVIVIAVSVLYYMGVLNPGNVSPNSCTFPPGISCVSYKLMKNGTLDITLGQAMGNKITITGFACSDNESAPDLGWVTPGFNMSNGGRSPALLVECYTGRNVSTGEMGDTDNFRLYLNYTESDKPSIDRRISGDMAARYE